MTNAELREIVSNIEAFVGITDEVMEDPTLVDLVTQIVNLDRKLAKFEAMLLCPKDLLMNP